MTETRNQKPLYQQVKDHIVRAITEGRYGPEKQLPTEAELCEHFSVSRHTVQKAMADLVAKGVIQRRAGQGTFVSPLSVTDKTRVGLVMPYPTGDYSGGIASSLESELRSKGYSLSLATTGGDPKLEEERIRQLIQEGVKGIVVYACSCGADERRIEAYEELGVPLVFIDNYIAGIPGDRILGRDREAGAQVANHLLEHNRRRIGFFCWDSALNTSVSNRIKGVKAALDEGGYELRPDRIQERAQLDYSQFSHLELLDVQLGNIRNYLERNSDLDAVVAANDFMAVAFYRVCREMGISIPDDLAIVGFCNWYVGQLVTPQLTTVDQHPDVIGRQAADVIYSRITDPEFHYESEISIKIGYDLVVRESCGCHTKGCETLNEQSI